jgi:subtilisin family serine protease
MNCLSKLANRTFFLLVCIVVMALGAVLFFDFRSTASASGIAQSVIVQLKDEPAAVWKARQQKSGTVVSDESLQAYRNSITAKQNAFLADLQARGVNYQIDGVDVPNLDGSTAMRADYRFSLVLNAVTLVVPGSAIETIKSMPQVKSVKPNDYLTLELNESVKYINAPAVYGQYQELTPFDDFREGYEAQGMNVAVLDTGIDWTHPMFGGDPTPPRLGFAPPTAAANSNKKVIYYMSFSGGLIDDFGHGTAASSDIAGYLAMAPGDDMIPGTADDKRLHGVAPQARLMGYKVCTGTGSCVSASTILGIEDAISPVSLTMQPKPIAHVINMSLGGAGGPDSDTAIAADNAALLGTIVVASAGNEGPGEGTVGAPAAGRHVIAVGATTHPGAANSTWSADLLQANTIPTLAVGAVTPASGLAAQAGYNRVKLYKMAGAPDPAAGSIAQRYALVNLFEAGSTYPASVAGRIALIKDAGLASATFFDTCASAAANGAVGAILISTTTNPTSVKSLIPCAIVSPEEGEVLVDAISSTDDNATDPPNGTVSELPLRMNPYLSNVFVGETASFSSRGPVQGLGQVKPDVTAPGVEVLSATVAAGLATQGGGTMFDPSRYIHATGTSFSGPHISGVAAILKQAHLSWSPDMVRTAMINTSTNLRRADGSAKADGNTADSINEQGGGLVDVAAAVNTKALMGVEGDGIAAPGILGSHSFGEKAVLNNRIVNTFDVTVTLRDVSGQAGSYTLSTVNNRSTDMTGVTTSVSKSTVSVPANGSTTFKATIKIDGSVVRSTDIRQFQWYVVATANGKKLRMPMYLQATPSLPSDAISSAVTKTYTGTVLIGDGGAQRDNDLFVLGGASYIDVPFQVDSSTLKVNATLTWDIAATSPEAGASIPDLDFMLYDPNGTEIKTSATGDTYEHLEANTTIPGTYIYRVYGWANGPTDFKIDSTELRGSAAPIAQPIAADFIHNDVRYDFDGNYTLSWQPQGTVESYEIETSKDGVNWSVAGTTNGTATSATFTRAADGIYSYRIRSITAGRIGKYVTTPSNVVSITVSRRVEVDATNMISPVNRSITFPNGATELVTALKNTSTTTLYPLVKLRIISVQSTGNSVRVTNADNAGDGVTSPAIFDYSTQVGNDLVAGEESGDRTIKFTNPNTVLFTFKAKISAYTLSGSVPPSGQTTNGTGETAGTTTAEPDPLSGLTGNLLQFTVNPLTKKVSISLIN